MTESTQLQTTESNNAGVTKMEPPPPLTSTSPAPSTATAMEQLQQQHLVQQQQQQQQQQYALKWNDFQSSILSSFRHLRDEEDFVDVTLSCDQRSFTAHKVVLSACSPYFRKLLKANPCEHPIVILRDIRCEDVENLLSFMYNGEVNVSHEQLPDFLKTAHLLQIRGLADVNGGSPMMAGFNATAAAAVAANNNKQHHNNNSISNNNNKFNFAATATGGNGNNNNNNNNSTLATPFNTPTLMGSTIAAAAAVAAAAATGAASLAAAGNNNNNNNINSNSNSSNNNNNMNQNSSNNNNSSTLSNALSAAINSATNTPAIQELKASSASPANHHWDLTDADSNRNSHLTPPPQKRIKSADLFRAQHGISPERLLLEREFPVAGQHALTRERNRDRDRSRETSRDRERSMELRESLLGQALENSNGQQLGGNQKPHGDLASLHAQSAGEDSNSSDTEPSDRGDGQQEDSMNGSLDNQRSHSFPSAFLGLQGIPGLLPGPSGMGANDFAGDVQQKFGNFLHNTRIKEEVVEQKDETDDDMASTKKQQHHNDDPTSTNGNELEKFVKSQQQQEQLSQQHRTRKHNNNICRTARTTNNNYEQQRSINSSPARSWHEGRAAETEDDDAENFINDHSSSASSAISLTVKTTRHNSETSTLYQSLMLKQEQQQQQQHFAKHEHLQRRHEEQQQQQQHQEQQQHQQQQQQQYLDELQVSHHQQQFTANLFMARTIALSRTRDFPEIFQNTSAAAVAAAAAAAASASAAAAANGAGGGVASGANYMLPCPLCETPLEQRVFRQHLDRHYPRDSPVCPVIECGRRFAHPNSVRNHMRIKHTLQWAKMKAMRSSGGPFAGGPDFK